MPASVAGAEVAREIQNMDEKKVNVYVREYQEYLDSLLADYDTKELKIEDNDDCVHNSMVLVSILDKSKTVNMTCGKMSAFRNSMYDKIRDDFGNDKERGEAVSEWSKHKMSESIERFLDRDGTELNIYVIYYTPALFDDLINPEAFEKGIKSGKLNIYPLPAGSDDEDQLGHITMGDNKVMRLELDKEKHSGSVVFNPPKETAQSAALIYKTLNYCFRHSRITKLSEENQPLEEPAAS